MSASRTSVDSKRRSRSVIAIALLVSLLAAAACQQTRTRVPLSDIPIPTEGPEGADGIVHHRTTQYRANVQEAGRENPWPPIEVTEVTLHNGADQVNVQYRDRIETAPGTRRHNLFTVDGAGTGPLLSTSLTLYSVGLPLGLDVFWDLAGGLPGSMVAVLAIDVPADMASGQYSFEIGLEIDGKDYGTVPCTIDVREGRLA